MYPYSLEYLKSVKTKAVTVKVGRAETISGESSHHHDVEPLNTHTISDTNSVPPITSAPEEVKSDRFFCVVKENLDSTKNVFIGSTSSQSIEVFISGYCYLTLIRGGLILNGFSFPLQKRIPVFNPVWMPFMRLCLTAEKKGKSKSLNSKFPYNCVLVESIDIEKESWLIMAEDFSLYKSANSFHESDGLPQSTVFLNSALICSIDHLQKLGSFEILDIPPSWDNAVDSILSDSFGACKIGIVSASSNAEMTDSVVNDNTQYTANPLLRKIFNSRVIVCGAKGVGKSSCMRYLINRYLSRRKNGRKAPVASKGQTAAAKKIVYVIDCDIGQPEFNPPGMISLHAIDEPLLRPCHLNMRTPLLSYYLGDLTTRNEPQLFATALKLLVEKFISISMETEKKIREKQHDTLMAKIAKNSFSALQVEDDEEESDGIPRNATEDDIIWSPLVVNTDGFVRFMGAEVLRAIVEIVDPTHILHLSTEKDRALAALEEVSQRGGKVLTVEPGRRYPSKVAAVDLRTLRLVSYFIGEKNDYLLDYLKKDMPDRSTHAVSGKHYPAASGSDHEVGIYGEDSAVNSLVPSFSDGNKGRHLYIQQGAIVDSDGVLALALLHQQTFCCSFDSIVLGEVSASLPFTQLLAAINACIVGICKSTSAFETRQLYLSAQDKDDHDLVKMMSSHRNSNIEFTIKVHRPIDDSILEPCVALAVVRHVDISHSNLEVITPADIGNLSSTITPQWLLMKGSYLQLPQCLMYCAGFPVHPYISGESTGEGSGQMKARTNVKRKRLAN